MSAAGDQLAVAVARCLLRMSYISGVGYCIQRALATDEDGVSLTGAAVLHRLIHAVESGR